MKRKIYQQLLDWKHDRRGEVCKKKYDSYLLIDFSRVNPKVIEFFDLYLDDLDEIGFQLYDYIAKEVH